MSNPFEKIKSVDFLDVGCSSSLDAKWFDLFPLLSYTGFDPNSEECERLNSKPHPYKTARYLPYAIAGEQGTKTMYKTQSLECYSLLHPNHNWLNRFSYCELFRLTGTESVVCTTLNALAEEQNLIADIIKIDTQGLELPIVKAGDKVLQKAFCVETETGFVENYIGETTYAQIDEFMRSKGFMMFDINIYRVTRKNSLAKHGKHQPLWCQALWLFDFIGTGKKPSREQALKALRICKALRYFDYGCELASYFNDIGIIESEILTYLERLENWVIKSKPLSSKAGKLLSLLPERINKRLRYGLKEICDYDI